MDTSDPQPSSGADESMVPLADVAAHGVIIPVPMICVNCNDLQEDQVIKNYRVIRYDVLEELMNKGKQIETAGYIEQLEISERFVKDMIALNKQSKETENMLNCITIFGNLGRSIDVDDTFIDASTEGISFDPIRVYENDKTGLLVGHAHTTWHGVSFYSQLGDDEQLKARLRQEMNETDLNQMYFMLECFERSLLFHKERVCNHTIKVTNLCLFYLSLIDNSQPIENLCDTDIKCNIMGYLIDVIVRSRVITKWRQNPCSKNLLLDLVRNYDGQNHMVAMCKLETPRERAEYILKMLSESPETQKVVANLSYSEYEKVLEYSAHIINGSRYYVFKSQFIHAIVATQGFASLNAVNSDSDYTDL